MNQYVKASILSVLMLWGGQNALLANPIITHRFTADPDALVYNGRVYVYCSYDNYNKNGYNMRGYILVSTDDMKNWYDHGEIFQVPRDASWAGLTYAPSAVERDGKFYLYFPNGASNIGVAVADAPDGPFKETLGKPLINRSTPNSNVAWCFDPAVFIDDDGQAYLYYGGGTHAGAPYGQNLRGIKLNKDMTSIEGAALTIDSPNSFEAAFMHKHNGKYYFSYSTEPANGMRIDYLMSDNPLTDFIYAGTILQNPRLNGKNINNYNNNHASIIEFKNKWYIFYHDRRASGGQTYLRSVSVDLLHYNLDGSIQETTVTADGPPQIKHVNPFERISAALMAKQKGINTALGTEGTRMLTEISDGDWIRVDGLDFSTGANRFQVRATSPTGGGKIELRLGSEKGQIVGTCVIGSTGDWSNWKTFSCDLSTVSEINNLYLVFRGPEESFRLAWYLFERE